MDVHLSVKAKLIVTADAAKELKATMEEFNRACNTLSELAFQQNLHRKYDLHHAGYRLIRGETSLPAQHVINAIAKVSASYIRDSHKLHRFKPHASVRYDARTMALGQDCYTASLTVCPKGRVTGQLQMSAKMRKQLCSGALGSAELVYQKGQYYLHLSITVPAPEIPEPSGSLGVDLPRQARRRDLRQKVPHDEEDSPQESLLQTNQTIASSPRRQERQTRARACLWSGKTFCRGHQPLRQQANRY